MCKDCSHLISGDYHDRRYHKCELYGLSHSEATDWRLSYPACGMYNMEVDIDLWNPILQQIIRESKPIAPPLEGQLSLEI